MTKESEKLTRLCLHRYKNIQGRMVIQLCPMDGKLDGSRLILTKKQVEKFCHLMVKAKSTFYQKTGKFGVTDEDIELYCLTDNTMRKHIETKVAEYELKKLAKEKGSKKNGR